MKRCEWATSGSPLDLAYHDTEWGVPVHDEHRLFEFLILEGAQAGLSWTTILKKRENYRAAYDNFDPAVVARYDEARQAVLLADPGIVRNRLKVAASVTNARAFLAVQDEFGGFGPYIWGFVDGAQVVNRFGRLADIPATTPVSEAMSKDLKRRGFKFVGGTICYAFMQAAGLVNDHQVDCFRYREVGGP